MGQTAPIILVHGLLGFDRVKFGPFRVGRYFPGIEEALALNGYRLAVPSLSKLHGVAHRAKQLRRFILEEFPNEQVHIFAHSMGGLDSRYMISKLGMENRVLSLTTIGTPHRGSSYADWAIQRFGRIGRPLMSYWRLSFDAFRDLTTTEATHLMSQCPDVPGIRYRSIGGVCESNRVTLHWRLAARVVTELEGDNDGVVSVRSAQYGESFELWHADHMNLVNRRVKTNSATRGHPADYVQLANRYCQSPTT